MTDESIDHRTLPRLIEAGALRGAHVIGQRGGWSVVVRYGPHECALAAQRSRQVRLFKKLETVVAYLKNVGLARFEVDAADFDPASLKTVARPDRAAALRRAHEAAEHDAWFRDQVERALAELDARETVDEDAHKARWAKQRAALTRRDAQA